MGAFWHSWTLWEKMIFVLGSGIALTILVGLCKLAYSRWRVRKFERIARQKQEEKRQMHHSATVRRGRAVLADIPFGVRALESGIEVEGVWISRPHTPASSMPGSPAASVLLDSGLPRSSKSPVYPMKDIPSLAMPQAVYPYSPTTGEQTRSGSRSPDRLSPDPRARQNFKPLQSSHLRYSVADDLEKAQGSEAWRGKKDRSSADSEASSEERWTARNVSDSSHYSEGEIERYNPKRLDEQYSSYGDRNSIHQSPIDLLPFTRRSRTDLESLASHRKSHAAEIGQLLPRVRIPSRSTEDWTSTRSLSSESAPLESPLPDTPRSAAGDPFLTPMPSPTPDSHPPAFRPFSDSDPQNLKRQSTALLDHSDLAEEREARSRPLSEVRYDYHPSAQQSTRASAYEPLNRPGRQVNTGFEVLPQGTFGSPAESATMPSITTSPALQDPPGKRKPAKLHKRNKSSTSTIRAPPQEDE